ncbi:hypothetical protein BX600DRAFT_443736 [Xylariales sp. PMI_506]|nr:hypothetical protein BX600DRAFT_443736 [Xylariales sp. PMI_506]
MASLVDLLPASKRAPRSPTASRRQLSTDGSNKSLTPHPVPAPARTMTDIHPLNELRQIWVFSHSLSMGPGREKLFVTYYENGTILRRVTISVDYRGAPEDSLELDLKHTQLPQEKTAKIYHALQESLDDIQFYDTVTNLKLQTVNGILHVHVVEEDSKLEKLKDVAYSQRLTETEDVELSFPPLHDAKSWLTRGGLIGRSSHYYGPSLSSLGSASPALPYSQTTSNSHTAVTDSPPDTYHGLAKDLDWETSARRRILSPSPSRKKPIPKPEREATKTPEGKYLCTWRGCIGEIKEFSRKCEWRKHMDKHELPYKCQAAGCEKLAGFTYSGGLLRHQREVHRLHGGPKTNTIYCPHGNCVHNTHKGFSCVENLNEHIRRVHSTMDPQWGIYSRYWNPIRGDTAKLTRLHETTYTSYGLSDLTADSLSSGRRDFSSGRKDYLVEGFIRGTAVTAVADTGAQWNTVSPDFAASHGLRPSPETQGDVRLGNGKIVRSPGTVSIPWSFPGESVSHLLDCTILPGCIYPLILSAKFLRVTDAMKKRVKAVMRSLPQRLGLKLLDDEKQRMWGFLDGELISALPDSGSDIMLVSAAYARSRGLRVDSSPENLLELELADGTRVFTSGSVKGLDWTFGDTDTTVRCDFYVLEGLAVDVILSNEFLFDLDVFNQFEEYFIQMDATTDLAELYNIRLISKYSDELSKLEEEYIHDLSSPNAFSRMIVQAELARQDRIRDAIEKLDAEQQTEADLAERERQRLWNQARSAHLARDMSQGQPRRPPRAASSDRLVQKTRSSFRLPKLLLALLRTRRSELDIEMQSSASSGSR